MWTVGIFCMPDGQQLLFIRGYQTNNLNTVYIIGTYCSLPLLNPFPLTFLLLYFCKIFSFLSFLPPFWTLFICYSFSTVFFKSISFCPFFPLFRTFYFILPFSFKRFSWIPLDPFLKPFPLIPPPPILTMLLTSLSPFLYTSLLSLLPF